MKSDVFEFEFEKGRVWINASGFKSGMGTPWATPADGPAVLIDVSSDDDPLHATRRAKSSESAVVLTPEEARAFGDALRKAAKRAD
jgi:hypothetical protein